MNHCQAIRITVVVHKDLADEVQKVFTNLKVPYFSHELGRYPILKRNHIFLLNLYSSAQLYNLPVVIFQVLTDKKSEDFLFNHIIEAADLTVPGHGSIYTEEISIFCPIAENLIYKNPIKTKPLGFTGLTGIFCIIQRGAADTMSHYILENGVAVPTITYGVGRGLRDRLGLLRITIPKEKEIVKLIVHSSDAEHALDFIIEAGKLDLPGKGFIFEYPIKRGLINTKISLDGPKQAASMEQVISALDHLYGNIDWRRQFTNFRKGARKRSYFEGVNIHLNAKEGSVEKVLMKLSKLGISGATISQDRLIKLDEENSLYNPARDSANLLIPKRMLNEVISELEVLDFFTKETEGIAYTMEIPRAFSYQSKLGKKN
ncbi:hypothetical protein ND861_12020 [Leptospira sp. 2 VSF19]|uniref:Uncharacterized protein n=1 Tax=Leptospira soteropolitanensis TaxID=2950025 RepID=A0AAW5VDL2_9LEPT|nr:hypothetical protein [Leptospira soteropolitanensis]MCW7493364.1 hypothetical protein [Leptospira soteropolitanensis]MCW7501104.1 hypothetical protein [Leptospira soteropolitanensis]MCW7523216.1 hypothetical protein [Leptospira soteropolitanensis]MCW7527077.1 hypothetical protein [Leptospira soteropolitanensis]MCW7530934.1 hypothetical protein [Leptospira soteropolitanensis]